MATGWRWTIVADRRHGLSLRGRMGLLGTATAALVLVLGGLLLGQAARRTLLANTRDGEVFDRAGVGLLRLLGVEGVFEGHGAEVEDPPGRGRVVREEVDVRHHVVAEATPVFGRPREADVVEARAREVIERVRLVATISSLDHLVRSGRVPGIAGWAGRRLNINPLFEFRGGSVRRLRPALSRGAALDRIVQLVRRDAPAAGEGRNRLHVAALHALAREVADDRGAQHHGRAAQVVRTRVEERQHRALRAAVQQRQRREPAGARSPPPRAPSRPATAPCRW